MIRALEAGDRDAWRPLFRAYGEFYETQFTDEVLDRVWELLITPGTGIDGLVSLQDDRIVAIAHYRSHPDTFTGGRDWFLDDLFVDPDARSAGHATALIQHLTGLARQSSTGGTLRWITAADNARAQRVYDRLAKKTTWVTYEVRL